jgi:hypothetical protein
MFERDVALLGDDPDVRKGDSVAAERIIGDIVFLRIACIVD